MLLQKFDLVEHIVLFSELHQVDLIWINLILVIKEEIKGAIYSAHQTLGNIRKN